MKRKPTSIPLSAVPAKNGRKQYTEEFKKKAVALIGPKSVEQVCQELRITFSMLHAWQKRLDPTAGLRLQLARSNAERRARLENAAMIVEIEGPRGAQLARRIRALGAVPERGKR